MPPIWLVIVKAWLFAHYKSNTPIISFTGGGGSFPKATMVASSVLANDGLEKRTPDLCHKTPMLNLSPLHPQYTIDFNPLMRHALAGFETEKDALSAFHIS